jgi:hypothetical protein
VQINRQFYLINKKRRRFLGSFSPTAQEEVSHAHTRLSITRAAASGCPLLFCSLELLLLSGFCSLELQISLSRSLKQRSSKVQVNSGRGQSVELRCGG